MDILQARKRAREEQDKQTTGGASPAEIPQEVEYPGKPEEQHRPAKPHAGAAKKAKPKPKKDAAPKKTKREKPASDVGAHPRVRPLSPPESPRHTKIKEIPQGARAPEEIELAPHEFQGLPGTQEMPELPEILEEELTGSVELGDEQSPDIEPAPEEEPEEIFVAPPVSRSRKTAARLAPATGIPVEEKKDQEVEEEKKSEVAEAAPESYLDGMEKISAEEMPLEFLSFMLGEEEYGIPLQRISEIIKPRAITEVPRVPHFVMGILTLRGVVIPVFDLAKRLSLGRVTISKASRIIIVYQKEDKVGLLVDRVRDVVRVLPRDIEPPPPVIAGVDMQFLEGVGRAEGSDGIRRIMEKSKDEDEQPAEEAKARRRLLILLNLERVATL